MLHVVDHAVDAWLVGGCGHSGGVDDEAAGLGVFHEGVVDPRRGVLGHGDNRLHVVGDDDGEHPAEIAPGGLEAFDDLFCGLEERRPDELVTAEASREDQPVADPPALAVGDESQSSEVDLELLSGRRVGDPDGDRPPPGATALDTEAGQGARWNLHPTAGEQDADLGDGQVVFQPVLDALLFVQQRAPGLAVAVGSVRTDPLEHLADQLVAELLLAAGALDP